MKEERARTLEREEADERREGRVVDAPALEEAARELQALPAGEERLWRIAVSWQDGGAGEELRSAP